MDNEKIDNMKTAKLLFKAMREISSKGDYQKALEAYQKIIASGHRLVDAYWGIGVCQHMLGNQEAAVIAAKEALQIKQDHFNSLALLATIYHSHGNDKLTYEFVSLALSCIPKSFAETSPKIANFIRKTASYIYSSEPVVYVEEMLGLDEVNRVWIAWAKEYKSEYEASQQTKDVNMIT